MAVFTHLTIDEIAEAIHPFDAGILRAAHPIAQGVENSNWKLDMEQKDQSFSAIFTLFEKRTNPDDLPFFMALMAHLARAGVPSPAPYKDANGQWMTQARGRPCVMVSFLNGQNMARQTVALMQSLGMAMAKMHVAACDFDKKRPNNLSLHGWQEIAAKLGKRLNEIENGLFDLVEQELEYQQSHWPQALPQGIIHADLFRDNVMAEGDIVTGLFDFYFACTDALVYDIAICLNCWCFDDSGAFRKEWAQAMLSGYRSIRPFSTKEQQALPTLVRGAALRFLLTRAYDWIHHPADALVTPKDPMEYTRYLRFFQSANSALIA